MLQKVLKIKRSTVMLILLHSFISTVLMTVDILKLFVAFGNVIGSIYYFIFD